MPLMKQNGAILPVHQYSHQPTHWSKTQGLVWTSLVLADCIIYGSYGVLVHLSKDKGHIPYSSASVVFLIELMKLSVSLVLLLQESTRGNFKLPRLSVLTLASYAVPGVLYCLNNNLAVHMQLHMDPTTYQVLSNLKIGSTALFYRYIIKRELSSAKWIAVGMLLLAGLCDSYGGFQTKLQTGPQQIFITKLGLLMMLTYVTISGLAAVYTEYILKKQILVSLNIQNILLYCYGIVLNGGLSTMGIGHSTEADHTRGFLEGFTIYTWLTVISQAMNGLIMSLVMKHGSNITRLFIISGAMLTTTVLSMIVLGTVLNVFFIVAAVLVVAAIYLYHM